MSTARAQLASISPGSVATASLQLPATKADLEARGVTRTHGRICVGRNFRAYCPVHAMWDQKILIEGLFATRRRQADPDFSLPLFPSAVGGVVTKRAMTQTIKRAATLLGVPWSSADGTSRISGHSLRPSGAQGMAQLGVDTWAIELLGRWGGKCVRQYVREASVSAAAERARSMTMRAAASQLLTQSAAESGDTPPAGLELDHIKTLLERMAPEGFLQWRVSLLAEVKDLIDRQLALARSPRTPAPIASSSSSSASSSSSSTSRESDHTSAASASAPAAFTQEVSSVWRKAEKRHVVAKGPPDFGPDDWITICGWKFGIAGRAVPPLDSHPLCTKCRRAAVVGTRGSLSAPHRVRRPPAQTGAAQGR